MLLLFAFITTNSLTLFLLGYYSKVRGDHIDSLRKTLDANIQEIIDLKSKLLTAQNVLEIQEAAVKVPLKVADKLHFDQFVTAVAVVLIFSTLIFICIGQGEHNSAMIYSAVTKPCNEQGVSFFGEAAGRFEYIDSFVSHSVFRLQKNSADSFELLKTISEFFSNST
jgi:hypothetical protein